MSWQPGSDDRHAARAGVLYGILAELGLALLLIALDRAGTHAGAWPLIPSQAVSLLAVAPFARRDLIRSGRPSGNAVALMLAAGTLAGIGNLLFLSATSHGQLAIVAVLTAMYPAVPVILARVVLTERWSNRQAAGLLIATAAVVLVSIADLQHGAAARRKRPRTCPGGQSASPGRPQCRRAPLADRGGRGWTPGRRDLAKVGRHHRFEHDVGAVAGGRASGGTGD